MEIKLENKNAANITSRDLEVDMSFGFVVRCQMGTLIALRSELEKLFGDRFSYPTLSSSPLFVVHWNDLSEEKKKTLGNRTR